MNQQEYKQQYKGIVPPGDGCTLKAERAFDIALDIRKFEIELYWKRATYFWTFIGATLAGYALTYKNNENDSWLLLVLSNFGFLFSVAWYLVNRGSKFWQNNWERHVDLLEDEIIGPLYKTIAKEVGFQNPLTAAGDYSVSKINQILSVFISLFWLLLIVKSLGKISCYLEPNYFKISVLLITGLAIFCLFYFGKSDNKVTKTKLSSRQLSVKP